MVNYNDKKLAIEALSEHGRRILEVEIGGNSRFFSVASFEPPVGGSVSALPYLSFNGFDITDFLSGDVFSEADIVNYLARFDFKYRNAKNRDFMFSDSHIWRYFS